MKSPEQTSCPDCGAAIPPGQPKGLCATCALKGALELSGEDPTSTVAVGPTPEAGERIGRYKLLEKIGEGGCGIVYMAEQEEPVRRRVALKVIKPGMDTREVIARFEAERQALALMEHPHIAKVFDGGATDAGRPYFVMELVRGLRITDYCDQKNLSTRQRLDLFMQVCQAVQHAHQKGIIHRDLKPSNILVTVNDGVAVPKVIDFGIAKATGQALTDKTLFTRFHQFLGTPAYISPEQAEMTSLDIDTRSDIYSLGVLLYELLTGRTPFDGKELLRAGMEAMLRTIREQEPVRPSARLSTLAASEQTTVAQRRQTDVPKLINLVRGDLDWIVMKCLEKDRARRYETANGLAADVHRHLTNEPVMARPPGNLYRFQRTVRRNRGAFAAGLAVTTALVLGLAFSTTMFLKERAAFQRTAKAERDLIQLVNTNVTLRQFAETGQSNALRLLYIADMYAAQHAWEQDNVGLVQKMLEATKGGLNCGFEWYYWQQQTHLAIRTLPGVSRVTFSADGRRVITGVLGRRTKVWEADTGRELLELEGTTAEISSDGRRVVTVCDLRTAKVWEADSGRELLTLKHGNEILGVAISSDGQQILTGGHDRTNNYSVKLWEAASGRQLILLKLGFALINSVEFSHDMQRIVVATSIGAKVFDTATGRQLLSIGESLHSAVFSPDGGRIATGGYGYGQTAKVWEATSGTELLSLKGHKQSVSSVAFSPDGRRIVTGSWDHTAKVWDTESGAELGTLKGHGAEISFVRFSPNSRHIVTSSQDKTTKIWEVGGLRSPVALNLHGAVSGVAFSADGRRIVTGGYQGNEAKVWDTESGRELLTLAGHEKGSVCSAAFSPDGQLIVTGGTDKTAKVWEVATGRGLRILSGHNEPVHSVTFSADGRRLATGSSDGTAKVWDAATGRELLTLKGQFMVSPVAFSPDGRRICAVVDEMATVWDAETGRELFSLRGHDSGQIVCVAFSPDGRRIITGALDHLAKVWNAVSGRELLSLDGHKNGVKSVAFSSDGRRIVTGSDDQTAKVWDADNGRELLTLKGHQAKLLSAAISSDGRRIITLAADKVIRLWEAASPEQVAAWQKEEKNPPSTIGTWP